MNVTNSRALLLSLLLCLLFTGISASDSNTESPKKSVRDLIIVQVDDQLNAQIDALSNYTLHLHKSKNKGQITIKEYLVKDHKNDQVKFLITQLIEKGISEENIVFETAQSATGNAYFTVSVTTGPDIQ